MSPLTNQNYKLENLFSCIIFILFFIYAITTIPYDSFSRIPLLLGCLLLIVYCIKYHKEYFFSSSFIFIIAAVLVSLLTWITTNLQIPETAPTSPRLGGILSKLAFIPIAFILAKNNKRIQYFILAAIIGTLASNWLVEDGFNEILLALDGKRTGLGGHIITMGIIYSTLLFACLIYFKRFRSNKLHICLWVLLIIYSCFGIIASQTRAIYLGLALIYSLFFFLIIYLSVVSWKKNKNLVFYFLFISIVSTLVVFIFYNFNFFDSILNKASREQSVFWFFISGNFDQIPKNSAGFRIHFWIDAYQWIIERPWTGWGEGANKHLHEQAGNFFGNRIFHSIHNDILEILLSHGIFGLMLYVSLTIWLYLRVYRNWKNKIIQNDTFIFFNAFLIFFIFNGIFMSLFYFKETISLWNIVLACYLAVTLNQPKSTLE